MEESRLAQAIRLIEEAQKGLLPWQTGTAIQLEQAYALLCEMEEEGD